MTAPLVAALEGELIALYADETVFDFRTWEQGVKYMAEKLAARVGERCWCHTFPSQRCPGCLGEHPSAPCPQEVLPL